MKEISDVLNSTLCISGIYLLLLAIIIYVVEQGFKVYLEWCKYRKEIVFSKLHEARAEVIKELYQKLKLLYSTAFDLTRGFISVGTKTSEDLRKETANAYGELYVNAKNYFELNDLYLSSDLSDEISRFLSDIYKCVYDYSYFGNEMREEVQVTINRDRDKILSDFEQSKLLRKQVETELKLTLDKLKSEFQKILGV